MFVRSLPRSVSRTTSLPTQALRSSSQSTTTASPIACLYARPAAPTQTQTRLSSTAAVSEHAIANPTLAGIEKRWEAMPPQEQAELWMQLRDRMKVDWHEMTLQEKKAAYWIAFGPHGPRAETPKGEGMRIVVQLMKYLAVSAALFYAFRLAAKPAPRTMTKEWQEASNEYAIKERMDPITGISSEGYQGKGFVQSPSEEKK
ncbi:Cytochrome c oxidase subunit 5A [Arachnomyces sp. PD_36]|nr:Cytochrome c oxidase subunit 5A [Arachnomyces sp. PD_36]